MDNAEFIKEFKLTYNWEIENATVRNQESFAILSENILFGISVCNISDVDFIDNYCFDNRERVHYYKVKSAVSLLQLLIEMKAEKKDLNDIVYSIIRSKKVNPDNPFYLKLYAFEGIRI